jgi:4-amino-4-deoxy-L-arabinose transferase-like glycosyltransferase
VLLIVVVSALYGARLGRQPIVGEESRWATGAREMLATGDWIVPRQQGRVFPERPPMTMWAMAFAGWLRGDVDSIAVRLPSAVAVVLTSLLIYGYARIALSQFAAFAAALVYATMGQVMQIGRLGESEALFALLVSASLLVWHLGYLRGWSPLITWSCGFGTAALAALVKGPQAPVYFVAITAVYLAVRRDWRYLFRWQYAAGAAVFVAIISAWQIPFYLASSYGHVVRSRCRPAPPRWHRKARVHLSTRNICLFAALVADHGCACQTRNASAAGRRSSGNYFFLHGTPGCLPDGVDRGGRTRPILHAIVSDRGGAHRTGDRALCDGPGGQLSAPGVASVSVVVRCADRR